MVGRTFSILALGPLDWTVDAVGMAACWGGCSFLMVPNSSSDSSWSSMTSFSSHLLLGELLAGVDNLRFLEPGSSFGFSSPVSDSEFLEISIIS